MTYYWELIKKCWDSEAFRKELVENPRRVFKQHDSRFSFAGEIQIHQDTDDVVHLVILDEKQLNLYNADLFSAELTKSILRDSVLKEAVQKDPHSVVRSLFHFDVGCRCEVHANTERHWNFVLPLNPRKRLKQLIGSTERDEKIRVFVVMFCQSLDQLYGNMLIFKTIRMGFPSADVCIIDNGSLPAVRRFFMLEAERHNCCYYQLENSMPHSDIIAFIIPRYPGQVVFLDPDVVFWENCESMQFGNKIIAGRLIPTFRDEFTQSITVARLHTSFLWIKDTQALVGLVRDVLNTAHFDFLPFTPFSFVSATDNNWYRYDTGASLYHLFPDITHHFGEDDLNKYDHLFCGTHLDFVLPKIAGNDRKHFSSIHRDGKEDYTRLRGIWKKQEEFFAKRKVKLKKR